MGDGRGEGRSKGGSSMGERQERSPKDQEIEFKYAAVGGGVGGTCWPPCLYPINSILGR